MNKLKRRTKKRLRKAALFVASFCVFTALWAVVWGQQIQWFNLFGQRTTAQHTKLGQTYVKQSDVDNSAVWTVLAQISMGNGSFKVPATTSNVYGLFSASQLLVNTDILSLVKNAENPDAAVDTHIAHTQATIDQITQTAAWLNERAQTHIGLATECLAKKRAGDAVFFNGVNELNEPRSNLGLEQSLEHAPCYITNRIKANAYAYLAQKVQTNKNLLTQRASLLRTNKTLLVNNSAYLEGDILERLLQLKRNLLAVNTSTSAPWFQRMFDFTNLDPNQPLPAYFKVLFVDHEMKIPTYQKPGIDLSTS